MFLDSKLQCMENVLFNLDRDLWKAHFETCLSSTPDGWLSLRKVDQWIQKDTFDCCEEFNGDVFKKRQIESIWKSLL